MQNGAFLRLFARFFFCALRFFMPRWLAEKRKFAHNRVKMCKQRFYAKPLRYTPFCTSPYFYPRAAENQFAAKEELGFLKNSTARTSQKARIAIRTAIYTSLEALGARNPPKIQRKFSQTFPPGASKSVKKFLPCPRWRQLVVGQIWSIIIWITSRCT